MLGIISNMNDMLQDVQGKKTVAEKRVILRSLGALIIHIGPAISNVAPQVSLIFFFFLYAYHDALSLDNGDTANNVDGSGPCRRSSG